LKEQMENSAPEKKWELIQEKNSVKNPKKIRKKKSRSFFCLFCFV